MLLHPQLSLFLPPAIENLVGCLLDYLLTASIFFTYRRSASPHPIFPRPTAKSKELIHAKRFQVRCSCELASRYGTLAPTAAPARARDSALRQNRQAFHRTRRIRLRGKCRE